MPGALQDMSIHELGRLLRIREISARELLTCVHAQIEATAPATNSFITRCFEQSEVAAQEADRCIARGRVGPLTGIPIAVKDNICMRGSATTCGSKMLETFRPPYDATVVDRLRDGGAVLLGKTNMDEFAMGSSTETSFTGPCRNPWNPECVAGGSSGGSAAAVAARQCIAALGSDTGGSIRQPASHCGVVGLKPTYGRVSRFGLVAFASSLDQIGTLTRNVRDAAIMLGVISGHDPRDATSAAVPVPDFEQALVQNIDGMRLGIARECFTGGLASDVDTALQAALDVLEGSGARIIDIALPHVRHALAAYYLIAPAEAASNLARYDGVSCGYRVPDARGLQDMYTQTRSQAFGAEVKRRIMLGTYALSAGYYDAYYKKASQVRRLISRDFDRAFDCCDVIITPTVPAAAWRIGEKISDPLSMYRDDVFTVPASLAGLPALSVPCGFTVCGLPVGLQMIAHFFHEAELLRCAHWYEQNTEWHQHAPQVLRQRPGRGCSLISPRGGAQ